MTKPLLQIYAHKHFPVEAIQTLSDACNIVFGTDYVKSDIVWTRVQPVRRREKDLIAVVTPCTNADHVQVPEGVAVLSLRGDTEFLEGVHATAEFTVMQILNALRLAKSRADQIGRTLHGKRVLVVGPGRIGRQVEKLVTAFGASVTFCGPGDNLNAMLPEADIVTVHVDVNDTTYGMFGDKQFGLMKRDAIFVNTSRGCIVAAPEDTTREYHICVVTDFDFVGGHVYFVRETDHVAGYALESLQACERHMATKLVNWLKARQ